MILLCGIPSEPPLARVREELERLDAPYIEFNQRRFAEMEMAFGLVDGAVSGWLRVGPDSVRLEDIQAVYSRVMDDAQLPELRNDPPGSPRREACRALHETLVRWYEIVPARVVNRSRPMGSNASKPYQAQLIREHGFAVPETLITNDPELVRAFHARHEKVVYKSMSGVRSVVQLLGGGDLGRLERVRWCPVQFQAFVDGTDVRVHVVGEEVFATGIRTTATDYRYAHRDFGGESELFPMQIDADIAERCVHLSQALGLPFSGIDLRVTPTGEYVCFEVNPSPAFSYFEEHSGQEIARALALYLMSG